MVLTRIPVRNAFLITTQDKHTHTYTLQQKFHLERKKNPYLYCMGCMLNIFYSILFFKNLRCSKLISQASKSIWFAVSRILILKTRQSWFYLLGSRSLSALFSFFRLSHYNWMILKMLLDLTSYVTTGLRGICSKMQTIHTYTCTPFLHSVAPIVCLVGLCKL